jgi:hypothetical protein
MHLFVMHGSQKKILSCNVFLHCDHGSVKSLYTHFCIQPSQPPRNHSDLSFYVFVAVVQITQSIHCV